MALMTLQGLTKAQSAEGFFHSTFMDFKKGTATVPRCKFCLEMSPHIPKEEANATNKCIIFRTRMEHLSGIPSPVPQKECTLGIQAFDNLTVSLREPDRSESVYKKFWPVTTAGIAPFP
jgi:hypothetical protein